MSSCGNPSTEAEAVMPRKPKFDKSNDCIKCKARHGRIVIRHAVYCKDCFILFVTYKFRRSLDASVNASPDGIRRTNLKAPRNLLIGFSGGLGSTVLLDLVSRVYFTSEQLIGPDGKPKGGKDHPRHASIWNKAAVCYVEVCSAFPGMSDRTDDVRAVVGQYDGFNFIPLRIEHAFDSMWWDKVGGLPKRQDLVVNISDEDLLVSSADSSGDTVGALRSYIGSLPTQTAILAAIQSLVRLILLHTASFNDCSHLTLGTSLTSLSVTLISAISQGGGFVLREETEEQWIPPSPTAGTDCDFINVEQPRRNVCIGRPLRDVGMKECAAWAWWSGLNVIGRKRVPGAKQSIGGLTKDFIVALERDYPSTVSTIVRTCGKLAPKNSAGGKCVLCARPAQRGVQEWKTRISIRSFVKNPDATMTSTPLDATPTLLPHRSSLTPFLCYACHTTLTSRSSRGMVFSSKLTEDTTSKTMVSLPVWVQAHLQSVHHEGMFEVGGANEQRELWKGKTLDRSEMHSKIDDFLLGD